MLLFVAVYLFTIAIFFMWEATFRKRAAGNLIFVESFQTKKPTEKM